MVAKYRDRHHAGIELATHLQAYLNAKDSLVLALPRGGVPVAFEVAKALHLPLDVFIVRKLGVPGHEELALGAIASGNAQIFNHDVIDACEISQAEIEDVMQHEQIELQRRERNYRGDRAPLLVENKTIILVDDGVATGASIKVAIKALRVQHPHQLIIAVPVAESSMVAALNHVADAVICPLQPHELQAVGAWFDDFSQTQDAEVFTLLHSIAK